MPVTVKCRLGVDDDEHYDVFRAFIDRVAAAGCRMFVVHARNAWLKGLSPKENREVPPLRYDWAYRLKRERPDLQVIVNGGIATLDEATAHLAARRRRDARPRRVPRSLPAASARCRLVRRRAAHARANCCARCARTSRRSCAQGVALKHITRHLLGLFAGERGGRAFRQVLSEGAHKPGADWSLVERALALTSTSAVRIQPASRTPHDHPRHRRLPRLRPQLPADFGPATARAAFLVAPDGFTLAEQSAADNRYMAEAGAFDAARASAQHRELQRALSRGAADGVLRRRSGRRPMRLFPNNVFATAGRAATSSAACAIRCASAKPTRGDIRGFFGGVLDYAEIDLSTQPHPCELTGALVIDRARGLGFCGLSERCDEAGARLMHEAFGLRATLLFDLAPGEYHTNVVLAVLAGRAAIICPNGFADPAVVEAIAALYAPHAVAAVAGASTRPSPAMRSRCRADAVWMSAQAGARADAGQPRRAGRRRVSRCAAVELDAIEAGGGSLRCCVGEIF